ncbi:MAG: formylglycine-generating enzyme family protein, partial [Thermoflexibacter sp.]|nr:formylglycine-generating enzyme family protein [Thermoflexibacter sp.]
YDIQIGECKIEMIKVQGGSYQMGGDENNPLIRLSDFWIGKYPVTQALYQAITGENPARFKGRNKPVENVSWHNCKDFLVLLNERAEVKKAKAYFRLPTEAEWEYAANGDGNLPQPLPFPKGEGNYPLSAGEGGGEAYEYAGSNDLHHVGWYNENSRNQTQEVGLKMPNALGIYDLSGNVWEWCEDDYDSNAYQKTPPNMTDPVCIEGKMISLSNELITNQKRKKSITFRVIRGGSWNYFSGYCTLHNRINYGAENHNSHDGFRLLGIFSVHSSLGEY